MPRPPLSPGVALLFLALLPACSTPPATPTPPPPLLTTRCPAVTACPLPALAPTNNGQLADSWQQHRAALEYCAAQINSIIQCQ
ncbi:Rz1-like lysis system protein LysC [Chromobacterium vaccinii]|uniref:Rz1-like lysis system protein LysC n=1 Tax=Chromobacterium vaccinii TaxID=1108595 RepID=UPI001C931505